MGKKYKESDLIQTVCVAAGRILKPYSDGHSGMAIATTEVSILLLIILIYIDIADTIEHRCRKLNGVRYSFRHPQASVRWDLGVEYPRLPPWEEGR